MSDLKDKALASLDELLSTGEILLKNLYASDKDNGDSAMEAISVMLMQLLDFYGPTHPVAKQLFPAMDVIKSRIDHGNYVGAIWDVENFIKSLKEIRKIVEKTKE
jgi:hypothetical protein